jgi:hypothetical protein
MEVSKIFLNSAIIVWTFFHPFQWKLPGSSIFTGILLKFLLKFLLKNTGVLLKFFIFYWKYWAITFFHWKYSGISIFHSHLLCFIEKSVKVTALWAPQPPARRVRCASPTTARNQQIMKKTKSGFRTQDLAVMSTSLSDLTQLAMSHVQHLRNLYLKLIVFIENTHFLQWKYSIFHWNISLLTDNTHIFISKKLQFYWKYWHYVENTDILLKILVF